MNRKYRSKSSTYDKKQSGCLGSGGGQWIYAKADCRGWATELKAGAARVEAATGAACDTVFSPPKSSRSFVLTGNRHFIGF